MENSETVSTIGVGVIVLENSDLFVFGADACIGRGTNRMCLEVIPVSISIRASSMVSDEVIIRVCDPETSGSLIGVEQAPRSFGHHDKVSFNMVPPLDTVLDEDSVSFGVVGDIPDDSQIFCSVNGKSSVK